MFQISNIEMNIIAAKIAKLTTQYRVEERMKKLTKAIIPDPIIKPNPSIKSGLILPLVNKAIKVIRPNTPQVIPKAEPIILQSMKMVSEENNTPTSTASSEEP